MRIINYLSLHFALLPFFGSSQLTDTTCIQSRWIAIKHTTFNSDLFLVNSDVDDSLDIVYTIKRLVEDHKLKIYNQNDAPSGKLEWYYIDYDEELERNLRDSSRWNDNPYFEIAHQPDEPLKNMYGEDSVVQHIVGDVFTHGDKYVTYVTIYPPAIFYVFPSRECDEIRIKEDRFFNDVTKQYEFKPVGLSFYFRGYGFYRGHEKFWVDLNDLFAVLENKNQYPWYNAIVNKKYQGFQYMQVSCYDDEIRK